VDAQLGRNREREIDMVSVGDSECIGDALLRIIN
jgi:hypothetical protein